MCLIRGHRNKLDQNALANAKLNSLEKDLKLHGTQYNTAISILYVGYLFMQIPSNMLLSSRKVRPSIYMSVCMMVWAVVAAVTSAVHNYTGLVLVRFFLGKSKAVEMALKGQSLCANAIARCG
jgi:MFS family permease